MTDQLLTTDFLGNEAITEATALPMDWVALQRQERAGVPTWMSPVTAGFPVMKEEGWAMSPTVSDLVEMRERLGRQAVGDLDLSGGGRGWVAVVDGGEIAVVEGGFGVWGWWVGGVIGVVVVGVMGWRWWGGRGVRGRFRGEG